MFDSKGNSKQFFLYTVFAFLVSGLAHWLFLMPASAPKKINVKPVFEQKTEIIHQTEKKKITKEASPEEEREQVRRNEIGSKSKSALKKKFSESPEQEKPESIKQRESLMVFEARNTIYMKNIPGTQDHILKSGMALLYLLFHETEISYFVKRNHQNITKISKDKLGTEFGRNIVLLNNAALRGRLLNDGGFNPATSNVGLLLGVSALKRIVSALRRAGVDAEKMVGRKIELEYHLDSGDWELVSISKDE